MAAMQLNRRQAETNRTPSPNQTISVSSRPLAIFFSFSFPLPFTTHPKLKPVLSPESLELGLESVCQQTARLSANPSVVSMDSIDPIARDPGPSEKVAHVLYIAGPLAIVALTVVLPLLRLLIRPASERSRYSGIGRRARATLTCVSPITCLTFVSTDIEPICLSLPTICLPFLSLSLSFLFLALFE